MQDTQTFSSSSCSLTFNPSSLTFCQESKQAKFYCKKFLLKKERFCKLIVKQGAEYCGEHDPLRILCTLGCSSTFRDLKRLKKHLEICSKREKVDLCYYNLNVNCGLGLAGPDIKIADIKIVKSEFQIIHDLINNIFKEYSSQIETSVKTHSIMQDFQENRAFLISQKHGSQQASLLGHMRDLGLLDSANVSFQEFGAGKAAFSQLVMKIHPEPSQILLIDRKQHKLRLDKDAKTKNLFRVLVDIKDLELSKVAELDLEAVAYSKHLCGNATDLSLRAIDNFKQKGGNIKGLVIALCCHQICSFSDYINPDFLKQYNIAKHVFDILRKLSSWGVCGDAGTAGHWSGLTFLEREELGFKAKRVLDIGRWRFVQDKMKAKHARLVYYVEKETTLENMALIANF